MTATTDDFVDCDDLRTSFALAMSATYKKEVPLYGDLIRIVRDVNQETLESSSDPDVVRMRSGGAASERLDLERQYVSWNIEQYHANVASGAIRLGTPYELSTMRRIFAVIGMYPVGYYDLSSAGLPMHATCFRPTNITALKTNPFRVFTTLLRPELIRDAESCKLALDLLVRRKIFSDQLLTILGTVDSQGGRLRESQSGEFIREAMKTFGWQPVASASKQDYERLKSEHPILADIACFRSSHINHLTPRTLNINAAQERMKAEGLNVKERIEGPPLRLCPILLRQTSFLALDEPIRFPCDNGVALVSGSHKARFGEIEERGAAVTAKGRKLYERLLDQSMEKISSLPDGHSPEDEDRIVAETFKEYPDSWEELRKQELVYFDYQCSSRYHHDSSPQSTSLEDLIDRGVVKAVPITYEDFLPLSAAGIFQSNLQSGPNKTAYRTIDKSFPDQEGYERALGMEVLDTDRWYADAENSSLQKCAQALKLPTTALLR